MAMSAFCGSIPQYELDTNWVTYMQQVDLFFLANNVTSEPQKMAMLLSCIGRQAYDRLSDLCTPVLPQTKSYEEIRTLMGDHQHPKPLLIAERFRFGKRVQGPTESIAQFVIVLQALSKHCSFGEHLSARLAEQMLLGLRSEHIQRALITEKEFEFTSLFNKATALEQAVQGIFGMRNQPPEMSVHVQQDNQQKKTPTTAEAKPACPVCGRKGHSRQQCRLKDVTCHQCGKVGHIRPVCRSQPSTSQAPVQVVEEVADMPFHLVELRPSDQRKVSSDIVPTNAVRSDCFHSVTASAPATTRICSRRGKAHRM
jgi:ribosomal protein L37AE/L43A